MMKRMFWAIAAVLVLSGCARSGGYANDPWQQNTTAQRAPSPLQPGANAAVPPVQSGLPFPGVGVDDGGLLTPDYAPNGADFQAKIVPNGQNPYGGAQIQRQPLPAPGNSVGATPAYGGIYGTPPAPAASIPAQAVNNTAPVKVALLVPLTGKNADLGQAMLQAAQLALFDMGNTAFQLMPHDTGSSPASAQKAAQLAIAEGSQLILGPLFSGDVRAVRGIAARAGINVVSFSTDWTVAGDNVFVMGFTPFEQVQRVTEYAATKGVRTLGVLAPQNDYGNVVVSAAANSAPRFGLSIADIRRFPPGSEDLSEIIAAFSHSYNGVPPAQPPYDAVLLPFSGRQVRAAAEMLTQDGLPPTTVHRLGTGLWDDSDLASEADLEGAWFAAPSPDLRRDFETRFFELYNKRPPRLVTLAYDATALASVLARNGAASHGRPDFDRVSITSPNGFSGIDGIFRFRPDGLVERGLAVLEIRAGSVHVIDPSPATFQSFTRTYGSQTARQY